MKVTNYEIEELINGINSIPPQKIKGSLRMKLATIRKNINESYTMFQDEMIGIKKLYWEHEGDTFKIEEGSKDKPIYLEGKKEEDLKKEIGELYNVKIELKINKLSQDEFNSLELLDDSLMIITDM